MGSQRIQMISLNEEKSAENQITVLSHLHLNSSCSLLIIIISLKNSERNVRLALTCEDLKLELGTRRILSSNL